MTIHRIDYVTSNYERSTPIRIYDIDESNKV
jgi:hypothetical protein